MPGKPSIRRPKRACTESAASAARARYAAASAFPCVVTGTSCQSVVPFGAGAASAEAALAAYLPSSLQKMPTQGWVRQVPSGFEHGARMVHAQSGWEIDVAQDPDGTWAVDSGRRCD